MLLALIILLSLVSVTAAVLGRAELRHRDQRRTRRN